MLFTNLSHSFFFFFSSDLDLVFLLSGYVDQAGLELASFVLQERSTVPGIVTLCGQTSNVHSVSKTRESAVNSHTKIGRNGCSGICLRTICTALSHCKRFPPPSKNTPLREKEPASSGASNLAWMAAWGPSPRLDQGPFSDPDKTSAADDRRQPCGETPSVPGQPLGSHS